MIEKIPLSKKRKLEKYLLKQQQIKDHEKTEEEKAFLKTVHAESETEASSTED